MLTNYLLARLKIMQEIQQDAVEEPFALVMSRGGGNYITVTWEELVGAIEEGLGWLDAYLDMRAEISSEDNN